MAVDLSGIEPQLKELLGRAEARVEGINLEAFASLGESLAEIQEWISYFESTGSGRSASLVLRASRSTTIEILAYTALGLARPSIMSSRLQIDLLLSYTYFRDHPVEWERVARTGDGYMLRGEVKRYHDDNVARFSKRHGLLEQQEPYPLGRVYRLLSAHIHGQSIPSPLFADTVADLLVPHPHVGELIELQRRAAAALSSYLVAVFAEDWPSLPQGAVKRVNDLLTVKQRPIFFRAVGGKRS